MSDLQHFSASALTIVLIVAGTAKLRSPQRFRRALQTYRAVPARLVTLLVYAVPALELSAAGLQWVPPLQPFVSLAISAMFVAFTLLLLDAVLRREEVDCGCFGTAVPEKVSWFSIARNAALISLSLAAVLGEGEQAVARVPAALAGIGAGILILVLDQALTMFLGPPGPRRIRS